ncbi:uncharacterized protein LOC127239832 [Andrographis paniculata]|uniref:uncharacterized protein LOC127239832 n=1 Tax=Andrographis paniculata TaxID=175694 RepID=UPI0021E6FF35|nr:uncharacterized protein LOC127239832 [Andrographis paniculata]
MGSTAKSSEIVRKLKLQPHPEGGFYYETVRDFSIVLSKSNLHLPPHYKVDRPISTSIYFLLPSGSVSHLHRIPCAEIWHFYYGQPLTVIELDEDNGNVQLTTLGPDPLASNQVMQYAVRPYIWFGAFPTNDFVDVRTGERVSRDPETNFSLVGCTCAPAFQFEDFELAKRAELVRLFPRYEKLISILTFP